MMTRTRVGLAGGRLLLMAFWLLWTASVPAQIPAGERATLVSLYTATSGAFWTRRDNWNGPVGTECRWYGVTCNSASGGVSTLFLSRNNLVGTLPSLSGLTALEQFHVDRNQLVGSLPALNGLKKLRNVNAHRNQLTGSIPSLSGLSLLTNFDVTYNDLTGGIPPLVEVPQLSSFLVGFNRLSGTVPLAPPRLSPMQSNLCGNNLVSSNDAAIDARWRLAQGGFTSTAGDWLACQYLVGPSAIGANESAALASLFASTGGNAWLSHANWNGAAGTECRWEGVVCDRTQGHVIAIVLPINNLRGVLPDMRALTELQAISLFDNSLVGAIPPLEGLKRLRYAVLNGNQLTGSAPSLGGLLLLESFSAPNNRLNGSIGSLEGAVKLRYFDVSGNQLTGSIPSLGDLVSLEDFRVAGNRLTGPIPSLAAATSLRTFVAQQNSLSGPLPAFDQLPVLQFFMVSQNQLSGSIPPFAVLPDAPRYGLAFDVADNQLTGAVPAPPKNLVPSYTNLCGNGLRSSGSAAMDGTWTAAHDRIFLVGADWLDCQSRITTGIAVSTSRQSQGDLGTELFAHVRAAPEDAGKTLGVYNFVLAPSAQVEGVPIEALYFPMGPMARTANPADGVIPCVLAQQRGTRLFYVTGDSMVASTTGVLNNAVTTVSVLRPVDVPQYLEGVIFFVGYGETGAQMLNDGRHRRVLTLPGARSCQALRPETGWWWNPTESGRGFSIEVRRDAIFVAGYLYDTNGHAIWIAASGRVALEGALHRGSLYQLAHGQTLTGSYQAPGTPSLVSDLQLAFTDARSGTLTWAGGKIAIQRFDTVLGAGSATPPLFVPENGWWWNPDEAGRGYFMEFKYGAALVSGYMFEADGRPVWYLAQNTMSSPYEFSGTWAQYADGQSITGLYKKPAVVNGNIGSVQIQFQDAANARLALPDGRQIPITRYRF